MSSVILYFFLYCFYNKVLMEEKKYEKQRSIMQKSRGKFENRKKGKRLKAERSCKAVK